ncbi:MAG TPA: T9SS type A sorting domain-containing protein, partial [Flavobacterium sp.]|nr:T9SS type A sorting domain-containing protein [Flavobacterium sp.]
ALGNDKAAFRNSDGCSDTNDNATDFTAATPAPRNSQTPVNICSGSTKQDNINGLNVFPNPANEVLFITSDANLDKNVQMFDMTGKKVLEVTTTSEINVANLKAGIYVAKITEAGKTATRKIVVR